MLWLIPLAVVFLLGVLPLGVSARYDADGPLVKLLVGPVKLTLYPRKAKQAEEKPKEKKKSGSAKEKAAPKEEKKGGKLTDFLPLVETAWKFLGHFRRKLVVRHLEMNLTMAGDDPCDLAVNYGRAWAAVGNLLPLLEKFLKIKKRDISVDCDFTGDKTRIYVRADLVVSLGAMVYLLARYGVRVFKQFMTMKKGGAEK